MSDWKSRKHPAPVCSRRSFKLNLLLLPLFLLLLLLLLLSPPPRTEDIRATKRCTGKHGLQWPLAYPTLVCNRKVRRNLKGGPRSPSFARRTLMALPGQKLLNASILRGTLSRQKRGKERDREHAGIARSNHYGYHYHPRERGSG